MKTNITFIIAAVLLANLVAPASARIGDREHLSTYPDFGRTPSAVWFGQGTYVNRPDAR